MLLPAGVAKLQDPTIWYPASCELWNSIKFSMNYYTSLRHYFYMIYNTSSVRMKFLLGWGVPLLCKVFDVYAPTFIDNTWLIKSLSSLIFNWLCVKFHIAIFLHPVVCSYCSFINRAQNIIYFNLIRVCCHNELMWQINKYIISIANLYRTVMCYHCFNIL